MYDLPPYHEQCIIAKPPLASYLASIIKIPPVKKAAGYHDLVCTDQDQRIIHEIVVSLYENSKFSLLLKKGYLDSLGAQIIHVHPLKFLGTIFSDPRLKEHMTDIFDDYFKRNGFLDGLVPSFNRETEKGNISHHLKEFAEHVQVPLEAIQPFFQSKDWEKLVWHLIKYQKP